MSASVLDDHLGSTTEREIRSAPTVWRTVLDRLDAEAIALADVVRTASRVLFLGCGSGYLAGAAAVELLGEGATELDASASVASDYVVRPGNASYGGAPLAVAISRSGETSETCAAAEAFRARTDGTVIAVTCRPSGRLANLADRTIAVPEADEEAVAQTRSVSAFLLLLVLLAARLDGADAREEIRVAATRIDKLVPSLWRAAVGTANAKRYVLLGGGVGHRIAQEAALKLTEMGRVPAWAWRTLEYRHGPLEALDRDTAVVGPLGTVLDPAEHAAFRETASRAGCVLDVQAVLSPCAGPAAPLCQLYLVHAIALVAARLRGRDADAPEQIRAFIDDVELQVEL